MPVGQNDSRPEFAVARTNDGGLEIPRFKGLEEAQGYVTHLYELKDKFREECEAWEAERRDDQPHPSGTNEPWWRWHKKGWKDMEWCVVVRDVTPWRDL